MTRILYKKTFGEILFDIVHKAFLFTFFIAVLYPLLFVLSSSLSSTKAVLAGKVWLFPVDFTLEGYVAVLNHKKILSGYMNSAIYMFTGTALNVVMTIIAAYPLSRKDFVGRNIIMFIFVFTMMFSGGMIPSYMLIRDLGLINTRAVMIIPGAMGVWNVIITRTFFISTIPEELRESAQLDGCSNIVFLTKIVLPLSKAIIAVIALFCAVRHWNAFFNALIYLRDEKLYPLQIVLRNILILNEIADESLEMETRDRLVGLGELLKYALIVVASLPVLVMYPFVQKYFVKGVMIGSLKG